MEQKERMKYGNDNNFIGLTLQLSVPIVLGPLRHHCGAGGIILLGVEGIMLVGAFAGVLGSYATGWAPGRRGPVLVLGGLYRMVLRPVLPEMESAPIRGGVGINLFASGITAVMLKAVWQTEGMSESVASIPNLTILGLSGIPVLGALFRNSPLPLRHVPDCGAGAGWFSKNEIRP